MADIADDLTTTTDLAIGTTLASDLFDGDTDVVRVNLVAGQRYIFDLLGRSSDGGLGLADPTLTLYNPDQMLVAFDDDAGTGVDSRIDFVSGRTGTYFLAAAAVSGSGTYRLSATAIGGTVDQHGNTPETAGRLQVGAEAGGFIDYGGDQDWFRVTLAAGTTYRLAVRRDPGAYSTLSDPVLDLYAADGSRIGGNDDANVATLDAAMMFTPDASGTYYLAASSYFLAGGAYLVSAAAMPADVPAGADTRAGVAVDGRFTGIIDRGGDVDAVRVQLTAGQSYEFELAGAVANGDPALASPLLQILNAGMGVIASSGEAGTAVTRLAFTATASGTFYLLAGSADGGSGVYNLSVRSEENVGGGGGGGDDDGIRGVPKGDFNGDGFSDILWQNGGAVSSWSFTAGGLRQNSYFAGVDARWKAIDTFDMNGDGRADILWRNVDGSVAAWSANGAGDTTAFNQARYFTGSPGGSWQIAATGDVDGDGRDDILWRDRDGAVSLWSSTGDGFRQNSYFHSAVGSAWQVAGLADFNGDGRADILWRNDGGAVSTWLSTGTGFIENSYYDTSVDAAWRVGAVTDLDGDGRADIVWRHSGGALSTWHSNGDRFDQNSWYFEGIGTDWQIAQSGDFDGDGRGDLLWHHRGGAISAWSSAGIGFDQNSAFDSGPPTSWQIRSTDFLM